MTSDSPQTAASTLDNEERGRKLAEIAALQERVDAIENELNRMAPPSGRFPGYYTAYYATTGFFLGMLGACTSLLFNIVGSLLVTRDGVAEQNPLRLIQVYLTF